MKKCAFLTMDSLEDFESYDTLLVEPFAELGWQVDFVSWRSTATDWNAYEAVVIRSPWDYQKDPQAFLEVLEEIDRSTARLENSLELVRGNINKQYLRDLEKKGIDIVPTLWLESFDAGTLPSLLERLGTHEAVIKPVVSANADDTFRLTQEMDRSKVLGIEETFAARACMIQPFMNSIISEGEFSVFFFGGEYSHTILKTPRASDFRVQEEHGGRLQAVDPEPALLEHANQVVASIHPIPLYARVDSVRTASGSFALMELELIEPSLYFNMDSESPKRFAKIFDRGMQAELQ